MYTAEIAKLCGEAYYEVLKILNKNNHDVYPGTSYVFPFKCLLLLYPRAVQLGTTTKLEEKMGQLMNLIGPEDVKSLIDNPMPQNYVLFYELGRRTFL